MKTLFIALLFAPTLVFAEPVSLSFNAVSIVQFGQAMFKGMMKRDFVVAPDVVGLDRRITIDVKSIDAAELPRFVENLLEQEGIQTTLRDGVYYLALKRGSAQNGAQDASIASQLPAQQFSGAVSTKALQTASIPADGHVSSDIMPMPQRMEDDESELFLPQNRTSEFVAAVISSGFGRQAAILAGEHVVLTGTKGNIAKMLVLCKAIDMIAKTVDVSASWLEVASNSASGRGISLAATILGARFGASLGTINAGTALSLKNANFELVIDALNTDGRFKQVSNSRLVGEDRTKLNLIVGNETPTVASTGNDNAGNRVQNVLYRPSGVIIDVVPKVLGNSRIRMEVDAQISSFKATSTGVTGSPTLIKRQLKTTVSMNDGEVIVLGGLDDSQATDSTSALPFLPASWSAKSGDRIKTDLVLVVSAKVLAN